MRNKFESISQNALAKQQHWTVQKKPSKWDKCHADDGQNTSLNHQNHSMKFDAEGDRELVQGSSTVFVVEDELPPPAFTKNILAKFRELEASSVDQTVPILSKVTHTSSRSAQSHMQSPVNQSHISGPTTEKDSSDGSEFTEQTERQNVEERGRTEKRSELHQRESSNSPGWSVVNELPQEGTARNLLTRWRTIEKQASTTSEDAPRRSSAAAKRSQSTSRIEVRRRQKATDDDDDDAMSTRYISVKQAV